LNSWSKSLPSPMRSILSVQVRPESAFKLIRIRSNVHTSPRKAGLAGIFSFIVNK